MEKKALNFDPIETFDPLNVTLGVTASFYFLVKTLLTMY
jgi:hypothetical protein